MLLPSRLEQTTLGDLLGCLHRERVSGCLEILQPNHRLHRVELREGLVCNVETPSGPRLGQVVCARAVRRAGPVQSAKLEAAVQRHLLTGSGTLLGRYLLEQGLVGADELAQALRELCRQRLETLFQLERGSLRFRPPGKASSSIALAAEEFLHGRPRRQRRLEPAQGRPATAGSPANSARRANAFGGDAWSVLGVVPGADLRAITAAFRRRAAQVHPDLGRGAVDRAERHEQFLRLSAAYRSLVA